MDYFDSKEPAELRQRLVAAAAFVVAAFLLLGLRFWYLQVVEASLFQELSHNNRIRLRHIDPPRGIIYDRDRILLAENRPGFDLAIVPEDVVDREGTLRTLSVLVDMDVAEMEARLKRARRRSPFQAVTVKEDLDWEEMVRVEGFKFELPGVVLDVGPKRIYPFGEITAHLIGYLGEVSERELAAGVDDRGRVYRRGDVSGKYGIERAMEGVLRGRHGGKQIEVDALGREVKVLEMIPPEPGDNIRLTIDLKTQIAAWAAMRDQAGAVAAIEPATGRVIALVSTPSFDPNVLTSGMSRKEWERLVRHPRKVLTNRAIQGQYPPASTFKPITAAAALEENVLTLDTEIFSGPVFRFMNRDYRDWKESGHGRINVHRAIVESSDTFFYQVGVKLGVDRIAEYARRFGLGRPTGLGLPDEKSGLVPSTRWKRRVYGTVWYPGETLSVAVGQGYMLATPLQLLAAYSAIAAGGRFMKPQLIEEITAPDGTVIKSFEPVETGRLDLSPRTLEVIRNALRGVVHEEGGTARRLAANPFRIAGKTGTAQVATLRERVDDIEEVPYRLRDHAWFAGFAPYDDPRIAVVVIVEHGGFGARAAAPVAYEVIKAYLEERYRGSDEEEERPAPYPAKAAAGTAGTGGRR
ncbi:MAG TPA: penicillin-binding protein 2 [Deltaproteobacteria bacterium]|nr:penicillin-binding protein 2 [Deltaproteobacteria bacterium]